MPIWNDTTFEWAGGWWVNISFLKAYSESITRVGVFEYPAPPIYTGLLGSEIQRDEVGYAIQSFAEAYIFPPPPDDNYPWVQVS